jgi:hypothetical protein
VLSGQENLRPAGNLWWRPLVPSLYVGTAAGVHPPSALLAIVGTNHGNRSLWCCVWHGRWDLDQDCTSSAIHLAGYDSILLHGLCFLLLDHLSRVLNVVV